MELRLCLRKKYGKNPDLDTSTWEKIEFTEAKGPDRPSVEYVFPGGIRAKIHCLNSALRYIQNHWVGMSRSLPKWGQVDIEVLLLVIFFRSTLILHDTRENDNYLALVSMTQEQYPDWRPNP